jgi:hypothetical protein
MMTDDTRRALAGAVNQTLNEKSQMPGTNKKPWLPHQVDLLERLIEGGRTYPSAAPLVGHTILSCRTKMSEIRNRRLEREWKNASADTPPTAAPVAQRKLSPVKKAAIISDPPHTRATSTAKLLMDAELRGRIEVLGVTAGLFGDPLPGRSALDRRNASCGGAGTGSGTGARS